jgi:hypothetical protein
VHDPAVRERVRVADVACMIDVEGGIVSDLGEQVFILHMTAARRRILHCGNAHVMLNAESRNASGHRIHAGDKSSSHTRI